MFHRGRDSDGGGDGGREDTLRIVAVTGSGWVGLGWVGVGWEVEREGWVGGLVIFWKKKKRKKKKEVVFSRYSI